MKISNLKYVIVGLLIVTGAMALREVVATGGLILYTVMTAVKDGLTTAADVQNIILGVTDKSDVILAISALGTLVWICLFGFIYRSERKKVGQHLFEGKVNGKRILVLLTMGVGLQFIISSVLNGIMLAAPWLLENYMELLGNLGMGNSLVSFVFIVLIAPIGEELVFRGVVFDYLKKHTGFWIANIFQALFFGIYHMNLVQGLYAFCLGLFLGWVSYKYGSVREGILLHMAVNLCGCLISLFFPEAWAENLVMILLFFIGALALIVFSGRAIKQELRIKDDEMKDAGGVL